jgi:glycosyltransferase involved in cell wall biosynthesis
MDKSKSSQKSHKKITVAFICDDLMIGGWTTLVSLILHMREKEIEPLVICLFGKGPNADILEKAGVEVHCFYFNKFNFIFRLLSLSAFLKKEKVDIVHSQLDLSHIIGIAAAVLAGIPFKVKHIHTIIETRKKGFAGWLLAKLTRKVDMVLAVSHSAIDSFKKHNPEFSRKTKVIHNGIDIDNFRARFQSSKLKRKEFGLPENAIVCITVANLKWQKGHKFLIEAASLIDKSERPHFLFVGEGPERNPLEKLIQEKGLNDFFHFAGQRTDIPELLAIADIFVLPSILEGLGICLIEAFAAGLPVIATETGGIPEIAKDGKNAILIPPSNPNALVEAIKKLNNSPDLRQKISEINSLHAKDFSIDIIADLYLKAYKELTES